MHSTTYRACSPSDRYEGIIGVSLRARGEPAQRTEAIVGAAVLARMLDARRHNSIRRQASAG
jgi:hypothetical protein